MKSFPLNSLLPVSPPSFRTTPTLVLPALLILPSLAFLHLTICSYFQVFAHLFPLLPSHLMLNSFKIFFFDEPFLKPLLNLLQRCFCFVFWSILIQGMWDFSSLTRDQMALPALESEVLTTGTPVKFLVLFLNLIFNFRTISLQYCDGSYLKMNQPWYTYVPSLLSLPPTSLPIPPF